MGDPSRRYLSRPVLSGKEPHASRPGIDRSGLDNPAVLARLGTVETTRFDFDFLVRDSQGHDPIRDMCRILPVMTERRLRQLRRGRAVWKGDWSERRVTDGRKVGVNEGVFGELMRVMESQTHD